MHDERASSILRSCYSRFPPLLRRCSGSPTDSAAIALLDRYELTDQEQANVYGALVNDRPLAFQAALTVQPEVFPGNRRIALFDNYANVTPAREDRFGDTLPLLDVRAWFADLAARIWDKINV